MPELQRSGIYRLSIELRILSGYVTRQSVRALEAHFEAHQIALTYLQYGILRALHHERFTLSALSHRFGLDPSTLVPVVNGLVKRGFVNRERDPEDRRRVPLTITNAGIDMLAQLPPADTSDPVVQSLTEMGEADAEKLITLLRTLIMNMPEGAVMLENLDARTDFHQEASSNAARCNLYNQRHETEGDDPS